MRGITDRLVLPLGFPRILKPYAIFIKGINGTESRDVGFKNTVAVRICPSGHGKSADDPHVFIVVTGVCDRILAVTVSGRDGDRFFLIIRSFAEADRDILCQTAVFDHFPHHCLCRRNGRKRMFKRSVTNRIRTAYGYKNSGCFFFIQHFRNSPYSLSGQAVLPFFRFPPLLPGCSPIRQSAAGPPVRDFS